MSIEEPTRIVKNVSDGTLSLREGDHSLGRERVLAMATRDDLGTYIVEIATRGPKGFSKFAEELMRKER